MKWSWQEMTGEDEKGKFRTVISVGPDDEVDAEISCPVKEGDYGFEICIPNESYGRKFMTLEAAQGFIERKYAPRAKSEGLRRTTPSQP